MNQSTLRLGLTMVLAVVGIIAWNLWSSELDTPVALEALPDLPANFAPAPSAELIIPASFSETA